MVVRALVLGVADVNFSLLFFFVDVLVDAIVPALVLVSMVSETQVASLASVQLLGITIGLTTGTSDALPRQNTLSGSDCAI